MKSKLPNPVLRYVTVFTATMASLLAMADGPSALRPQQAREGLVFKARNRAASFKAISNAYLLKQKG